MATQSLTIVSMDDGKATIVIEYNDATNRGTALVGTNNSDKTMVGVFERTTGGGGVTATLAPGQSRRVNLPNGLQLGLDSETGEASITGAGHNIRLTATLG